MNRKSVSIHLILLLCTLTTPCVAADVVLGLSIPANQRKPLADISHDSWSQLLQKYVNERGMVDYTAWNASSADKQALDQYIAHLSAARSTGTRDERLAFWINAYNAVTIKGILREYPTSSIRNHTAKLFGYNIWKNLKLRVEGQAHSLEHIEHEILRKMGEPRIHFAIVCASIGCPRLLNEAYRADQLDEQLTSNAKHFFADSSKFRFDAASRRVYLSPILNWFAKDFGSSQAAQLKTISKFAPATAAETLANSRVRVSYLSYDWDLNDQKTAK